MATTKLSEEILVSNFTKYKKRLIAYLGDEATESLIEAVGGDDAIMRASYATTEDTGLAYEGSLCKTILNLTSYAIKINELLPEEKQADKNSLVKVCLLIGLSKVLMFLPNDNEWEVTKRGMNYKFNDALDGALRSGERSILIATNAGIKFSEIEFEAMRINDKSVDDDYSRYYSSPLSVCVRQASEIINLIYKRK